MAFLKVTSLQLRREETEDLWGDFWSFSDHWPRIDGHSLVTVLDEVASTSKHILKLSLRMLLAMLMVNSEENFSAKPPWQCRTTVQRGLGSTAMFLGSTQRLEFELCLQCDRFHSIWIFHSVLYAGHCPWAALIIGCSHMKRPCPQVPAAQHSIIRFGEAWAKLNKHMQTSLPG